MKINPRIYASKLAMKMIEFSHKLKDKGQAFKVGYWLESLTDDEIEFLFISSQQACAESQHQATFALAMHEIASTILHEERSKDKVISLSIEVDRTEMSVLIAKNLAMLIRLEMARRMGQVEFVEVPIFKLGYDPVLKFHDLTYKKLYDQTQQGFAQSGY